MAFSIAAFSYIVALIVDAFLIFFAIYHVISFDELKTEYKNPIEQCNSLNVVAWPLAEMVFSRSKCTAQERKLRALNLALAFPKLVLPEYGLHVLINVLFLLSGEWISLLINAPLIAYHVNRYLTRPIMTGPGLYDATSVLNANNLSRCQQEGWVKLAFYLLSFFYYLYGMISSLIH